MVTVVVITWLSEVGELSEMSILTDPLAIIVILFLELLLGWISKDGRVAIEQQCPLPDIVYIVCVL